MSPRSKRHISPKPQRSLTLLGTAAAVLYCSWPLGYILNPDAIHGLASNLTASGQPYSLVFVLLDVSSGLLAVVVTLLLLRIISQHRRSWILIAAVYGLGVFGVMTIMDAVVPIDCVATATHACRSIFRDPYFIVHGIISIGSIAGLTMTVVALWWLLVRERPANTRLQYLLSALSVLWFVFGLGTALRILLNLPSADSQHAFILLNSLLLAYTPYLIGRYLLVRG